MRVTPEELAERTAGRTLLDLFAATAAAKPDAVALRERAGDGWREVTWATYADHAARIAGAFGRLGLQRGESVCLLVRNRVEHYLADLACLLVGAVPTSIYLTSSPEQVRWLLDDAQAGIVVVDGPVELDKVAAVRADLPRLEHVVGVSGEQPGGVVPFAALLDGEPVSWDAARAAASPDAPATVIYTSGTTGTPKAAEHTHAGLVAMVEAIRLLYGEWFVDKRVISYMPLAHIAERSNSYYAAMRSGHVATCCPEIADFGRYLPEVRPQYLFAPPRIWEKLSGALEQMVAPSDQGGGVDPASARVALGLDQLEIAVTAAASLPPHVMDHLASVGVSLVDMYGMTELGTVSGDPYEHRRGTLGRAFPGVELRVAADGEIEARGPMAFRGYRGRPDLTAEILTPDHWVRTGDLGRVDEDGYLELLGRKKDLIITAGGKNIAPAPLESAIASHPLVGTAIVVGEARRFPAALIVLDPQVAPEWARQHELVAATIGELATDPDVRAELERHVEEINQRFSRAEQVKRIAILDAVWGPDSEELTPTMKVRRAVVASKYQEAIDALYS